MTRRVGQFRVPAGAPRLRPAWWRRHLYDVAAPRARMGNRWDRVVMWLERGLPVSAQPGTCCHCKHPMCLHTDSGMCLVIEDGEICRCIDGGTKP